MPLVLDTARPTPPPSNQTRTLRPVRAFLLALAFIAGLLSLALLPAGGQAPRPLSSILTAGAILLAWNLALLARPRRHRRGLELDVVVRKQHYVQACAHTALFLYWGYYWRPVYDFAYLIVAQLLFAYAFELLLAWSRGRTAVLGFGPLPIVLSTNLFLWFEPDWFYLQFLMIAVGFAAKAFITWNRDGRRVHIFNPSAFTLTVFSVALILSGRSDITSGQDIAVTQFYPPHIYAFIFLIALPGQLLFGVTTMTLAAVATTCALGLMFYAATGTYYFFDSYIPVAVFLGMHLLFTDPSTAPKTEAGRIVFGGLYGLSTVALYAVLGAAGVPAFYDKLLQVPVLNLSVKWLDRVVRSERLQRFDPARIARGLSPPRRNLAYTSLWAALFAVLTAAGAIGDAHQGQWIPFWRQACAEGRYRACGYLAQLYANHCRAGSGWACNELGVLQADTEQNVEAASDSLQRGCELGFEPACTNHRGLSSVRSRVTAPPPPAELPILLRGSKGPLTSDSAADLRARACEQQWDEVCR